MNYGFTDRVRKVLAMSREEAIRLQHDYVGTEHILLGLVRERGGIAATMLTSLYVDLDAVRERVDQSVRKGKTTIAPGELPYTSRAKKVLEYAMAEAKKLHHAHVGTEHLLLGLAQEEKGIAAQVLRSFGVGIEEARRAAVEILSGGAHALADASVGSPFRVQIDDESDESIYEQIVAQIREAVATGALRPGRRLWPVRTLADELDIAPGTVARAYRELERLDVVETDGARGTRVAEPRRDGPPADDRRATLVGLLRPVAVAAFHMGATSGELRAALDPAMEGIFDGGSGGAGGGARPA